MNIPPKLLSGRYFLALCCGATFIYCAVAGKLPQDAVEKIVTLAMVFYFTKGRRANGEGSSGVSEGSSMCRSRERGRQYRCCGGLISRIRCGFDSRPRHQQGEAE